MPVVQVNVWQGISLENKKKIVEGITKVLKDISISSQAITIIISEEPKENWDSDSKLHIEKFADIAIRLSNWRFCSKSSSHYLNNC